MVGSGMRLHRNTNASPVFQIEAQSFLKVEVRSCPGMALHPGWLGEGGCICLSQFVGRGCIPHACLGAAAHGAASSTVSILTTTGINDSSNDTQS